MARNWRDIRADAVAQGRVDLQRAAVAREEMRDAVLAHRLAEIRKALGHARQADVAALMGVSQARVSKLESGDLSHTELGTLQAYVAALGGHLRIVAEFGENTVELTGLGVEPPSDALRTAGTGHRGDCCGVAPATPSRVPVRAGRRSCGYLGPSGADRRC